MAGKGKSMVAYDWLIAYQVGFKNGEIPYCEVATQFNHSNSIPNDNYQGETNFILQSKHENQETIVIKKDLVNKLSFEAKDVVKLLLNSPSEIVDSFSTSKYKCTSKNKIMEYLVQNMKWPKKKVVKVFTELKTFTKELDQLE
jgi:hypothetical protein